MKPQSPTVKKKFNFLELYAGFKGFSKAVTEVNGDQVHVLKPLELYDGWDISPRRASARPEHWPRKQTTFMWPSLAEASQEPEDIPTPYLYKTGGGLSKCKLHVSRFFWGEGGGLKNVAYI